MFRGQFTHALDAKGRVSVPARFRELLLPDGAERFVVTPDPFDPCLQLHSLRAWEALEARIAALPHLDPHVVHLRRVYVSAAVECELDRTARLLVPPHLRERAGFAGEVVFAGMGPRIDLWSRERWEEVTRLAPEAQAAFREAVAAFGI